MRCRARAGELARLTAVLLLATAAACRGEEAPEAPAETSELFDRITRPGDGAAVHLVRLVQRADAYAFDPTTLTVARGDVVRFVMSGSQPESVVFDAAAASPEAAGFIRANQLDRGVLLTEPGQAYDVSFREAPPGTYPFESLPHGPRGMRGTVTVTP